MSSAANHRARSHQSHARRMSAMSGSGRRTMLFEANKLGGRGAPLIARIQAFHRMIAERRRRGVEDVAAGA